MDEKRNHLRIVIYLPDSIKDVAPLLKRRINKQRNVLSVLLESLLEDLSLWYSDVSAFQSFLDDLLCKNVKIVPVKLDKDTLTKLAIQKIYTLNQESATYAPSDLEKKNEEKDYDLNFEDVLL